MDKEITMSGDNKFEKRYKNLTFLEGVDIDSILISKKICSG